MKKIIIAIAVSLCFLKSYSQNQGISNNWLMGYANWGGLPYGETKINFFSGTSVIDTFPIPMDFNHTHANISDTLGNLLFYTNGYYIADASNDTMQNGSGINPGAYANFVPDGFLIPQGALILKNPGFNNYYHLFHETIDNYPSVGNGSFSFHFYMTTIDMNLAGGLGGVTAKNISLINDSLTPGKIVACKHANGRDWWIVFHQANSNLFYKLLFTPYGISGVYTQNIGAIRTFDAGQAKFSPNGEKFAFFHYFHGLDIYDFDRCTGMLSNAVSDTTLPWIVGNVGCEFSPNSNLLYVSNIEKVYQYDLTATNIIGSRLEVAAYDNFYDVFPGLGTYLCYSQLAPDGKIYITTGNGTRYFHVINSPDSLGLACNLLQHSLFIPTYNFNTLPNPPNYFLGKIVGGPCDTVPFNNAINELPEKVPKVMPNPTSGKFTLWFGVHDKPGWAEIYDINGKCIHKETVPQWSQYKQMDISKEPQGVYLCRMSWGERNSSVKIIKE
jgi:hypothetical protein